MSLSLLLIILSSLCFAFLSSALFSFYPYSSLLFFSFFLSLFLSSFLPIFLFFVSVHRGASLFLSPDDPNVLGSFPRHTASSRRPNRQKEERSLGKAVDRLICTSDYIDILTMIINNNIIIHLFIIITTIIVVICCYDCCYHYYCYHY